jgi:hypothetical protein
MSQVEISFATLQPINGKCLICNKDTKPKLYKNCFFDLCENCKRVKSCFTCLYSRPSYMRYKGKCDINWEILKIRLILDDDNKEEKEKNLNKLLKVYSFEHIDRSKITVDDLENMMKQKLEKLILQLPDCRVYKNKKIGNTIQDFLDYMPCKRHKWADATKDEFDDYHADDWEDDYLD